MWSHALKNIVSEARLNTMWTLKIEILIILYCFQVTASNGSQLPLKLVSFWKCEPHTTNFRLDYIYQPSSLRQLNKPSLTNITVVVPVSGGVRKSLSKPEGSWVAEQNRIMWKVGDLQPTEEGELSLFSVVSSITITHTHTHTHTHCNDACTLTVLCMYIIL